MKTTKSLTEKSCYGVCREAEPQGGSEEVSFVPLTLWKLFRAHFWQKACNFCFVIKSSAKALHFHIKVKYCPESLWTPHPWRCSTRDWMGLWVTRPSGRFPAHSRRVARPLATQTILWFYEIPVPLALTWQDLNSCKHRGPRKVECFFLAHCMAGTMSKAILTVPLALVRKDLCLPLCTCSGDTQPHHYYDKVPRKNRRKYSLLKIN